jgi:hypothetical protein
VTRSARAGGSADIPSARVRFACEAVFLVLVAVGAALMDLRPLAIIILMGCAWLLVALIERASSREAHRAVAAAGSDDDLVPEPLPAAAAWPAVEARERDRWLFWRRGRARSEPLPSPTAALEERPARSHVRRIEPPDEPEPAPVAAPEPDPEQEHEPQPEAPPGPAVTKRPLDLAGLEEPPPPVPAAPPRPRFLRPRQPPPPPAPPPVPAAREWNLWDLERRAREQAGNAPRDEEWSALFTHLRVFANADGVLPKEFDELVRESFGTLIEAA